MKNYLTNPLDNSINVEPIITPVAGNMSPQAAQNYFGNPMANNALNSGPYMQKMADGGMAQMTPNANSMQVPAAAMQSGMNQSPNPQMSPQMNPQANQQINPGQIQWQPGPFRLGINQQAMQPMQPMQSMSPASASSMTPFNSASQNMGSGPFSPGQNQPQMMAQGGLAMEAEDSQEEQVDPAIQQQVEEIFMRNQDNPRAIADELLALVKDLIDEAVSPEEKQFLQSPEGEEYLKQEISKIAQQVQGDMQSSGGLSSAQDMQSAPDMQGMQNAQAMG